MRVVTYKPYPTMQRFHNDYLKYPFRYVAGPPGSGKSVGNFFELLAIGMRQEPTPEGIRPTKFGIVRSTYGELKATTLETMKSWLPEEYTTYVHSQPIQVRCKLPLPDGTVADMRFELFPIASEDDLHKLDSAEYTAMWLNEMTGLPAKLVGRAGERVGRYPPPAFWGDFDENGEPINHCTYRGVIGDYNYPPKDHWLVSFLHEGELPEFTMLYEQPPALLEHIDENKVVTYTLNPQAENLANLDGGKKYLQDLANFKALGYQDLINTRLLCRYGKAGGDGKAIIENFDRERHVAENVISPMAHTHTLVSFDTSGIHPCALFWQNVRGMWQITDGLYGEEMGLEEFLDDVFTPLITMRYPGCDILCVCDPANARDSMTATRPTDFIMQKGYRAITAPTNSFSARKAAAEKVLYRTEKGRVLISPNVEMLISALDGGYQYKKSKAVGLQEVFSTTPLKNNYSHWADAFQYGALHIIDGIMSDEDLDKAKRIAKASIRRGRR